jgi:hypothetical protein
VRRVVGVAGASLLAAWLIIPALAADATATIVLPTPVPVTSRCALGDCGTATPDLQKGPVGVPVTVTVDHDFFALVESGWCGALSVAFHEAGGGWLPGSGVLAPLVIVNDRQATFRVPELAPDLYAVTFSCGGDEAFGQPVVGELFEVASASVPDTSTVPAGRPVQDSWPALALAAGIAASVWALQPRRRVPPPSRKGR